MAQADDTELRDLVIEALEKNGSLAKIRALLRANVFLAFEEDSDNIKQNANLENILKLPEGVLCLSIVHEFLEFTNLKNTLFVYKSESRQNQEYAYEGKRKLSEKLNISNRDNINEPILLTLINNIVKLKKRSYYDQSSNHNLKTNEKCNDLHYKDDQNCTYIVHEDSSTTSNTNSDNSSDEKNKLHLRLQLDNSDTDTSSSDSTRDKSSSEYIPSEHVVVEPDKTNVRSNDFDLKYVQSGETEKQKATYPYYDQAKNIKFVSDLKVLNKSSSDSTSYVELKPFNFHEEKLINTSGVPFTKADDKDITKPIVVHSEIKSPSDKNVTKSDSVSYPTISSGSMKNEDDNHKATKTNSTKGSGKTEDETADYSNDFSSSPLSKTNTDKKAKAAESIQEEMTLKSPNKNSSPESQHQHSASSQSSVSISDVADLISEKSLSFSQQVKDIKLSEKSAVLGSNPVKKKCNSENILSDDSGDFSESPVPSLSNLSLDVHSD